jgi:hypothetical protein
LQFHSEAPVFSGTGAEDERRPIDLKLPPAVRLPFFNPFSSHFRILFENLPLFLSRRLFRREFERIDHNLSVTHGNFELRAAR